MTVRSALYVPGDQEDKLRKAFSRGADAVIVDLEDAVPAAGKDAARAAVGRWLAGPDGPTAELWVRVNGGEVAEVDISQLAVHPSVTGFVLAKTEEPESVAAAADLLDQLGSDALLSPLLESASAVLRAEAIARSPRVAYLQLGEVDLGADAGIDPGDDERELLFARSAVVLASAASQIDPPLGPVSTEFRDVEWLRRSTVALRRLGFVGRACIHPAQVAVAHDVFTPSADEIERARALLARFHGAATGVFVDDDGRMVDKAVVRRAELLLRLAR
jgi:citrate lyase subunit beta/citryl-CoA lyase